MISSGESSSLVLTTSCEGPRAVLRQRRPPAATLNSRLAASAGRTLVSSGRNKRGRKVGLSRLSPVDWAWRMWGNRDTVDEVWADESESVDGSAEARSTDVSSSWQLAILSRSDDAGTGWSR